MTILTEAMLQKTFPFCIKAIENIQVENFQRFIKFSLFEIEKNLNVTNREKRSIIKKEIIIIILMKNNNSDGVSKVTFYAHAFFIKTIYHVRLNPAIHSAFCKHVNYKSALSAV